MKQVDVFRGAKDFAIHGTSYKNAQSILEDGSSFLNGHYFSATFANRRPLSNDQLLENVNASIASAKNYGKIGFTVNASGVISYDSLPTVLIAIQKDGYPRAISNGRSNSARGHLNYGNSFPIEENLFIEWTDVFQISLDDVFMKSINDCFQNKKKKVEEFGKVFYRADVAAIFFADRCMTFGLRRRVAEKLKYFQKLPN